PFPESVIDMMMGGLGWPEGGWPEDVWRVILGEERYLAARERYLAETGSDERAGAGAQALDLQQVRAELAATLGREPSDDDLYSHRMYPQVFADFAKHASAYSDVSVLPTPAFFYGLKPGEEISASIEEGKVLIIRLISVGEPDQEGRRA